MASYRFLSISSKENKSEQILFPSPLQDGTSARVLLCKKAATGTIGEKKINYQLYLGAVG